mgnify:CR=1 FL=1
MENIINNANTSWLLKNGSRKISKGCEMKTISWKIKTLILFTVLVLLFGALPASPAAASANQISLEEFRSAIGSKHPAKLVGVYVDEVLALRVLQQSSASHVSNIKSSVTQFRQANQFGSIGLLAHNYLSGAHFFNIEIGSTIHLVYTDGSSKEYTVSALKQYQALSPNDPYSDFVDLDEPGIRVSSTQVINEMYGQSGSLVLQTCIDKDGNLEWGRHFIIATPADEV